MEQFLDFIFRIQWWQWLVGVSLVAGLYYVAAAFVLPFLKGVQEEHIEESERQRQEEEEREKEAARQQREAERKEYLRKIPAGPVEPVNLPRAVVRARNRLYPVPSDAETVFGTQRGLAVQVMARGVSRQHAKIRPEKRGYVLYDLMSEAGTLVDGRRIESHVLVDGDAFRIGPVEVVFKLGSAQEGEDSAAG